MIIKEQIIVKWTPMNRKHYEELGYQYTKKNDELVIWNTELCNSSDVFVKVKCDYCNKEYTMQYKKYYQRVINNSQGINKCACDECKNKKLEECNKVRYNGLKSYNQTEEGRIVLGNNKRKYTIEQVRKMFEEEGYVLLTNEYINHKQKLEYLCPKHGLQVIDFNHFKDGERRCKKCFYERNSGENNNQWNGGITDTNHYLRGLLGEWKQKSLEKYNYKCCISEKNGTLQIHHDYPFKNIVQDVFEELDFQIKPNVCDYTENELNKITELFLKISMENLGYPLTKELHKEFHDTYGLWTSKSDFWEFYYYKTNNIKVNKNTISKTHINSKRVKCIDINCEFNSANECERKSLEIFGEKMNQSSISRACLTGKPYKGHYFTYLEEARKCNNTMSVIPVDKDNYVFEL